ncbi:MAG: YjfB family protein [Zoogloeaceae bacterium]|jgi:hypothetical protein|nr:YjfB family protein [Zoogloeaceae bacterium]
MNINSAVGALANSTAQSPTGDAVNMLILKKAIQLQGALALQTLQALPPVNPSHLGQGVDTRA